MHCPFIQFYCVRAKHKERTVILGTDSNHGVHTDRHTHHYRHTHIKTHMFSPEELLHIGHSHSAVCGWRVEGVSGGGAVGDSCSLQSREPKSLFGGRPACLQLCLLRRWESSQTSLSLSSPHWRGTAPSIFCILTCHWKYNKEMKDRGGKTLLSVCNMFPNMFSVNIVR